MANYFVNSTRPDDSGDGSLALPKKTFAAAIALCTAQGDTLGCMNAADIVWTAGTVGTSLPAGTKGTSFSNFGTLVYGCDTSGNPAKARIAPSASGGCSLVRINVNTGYLIFRDITFDSSAFPADGNTHEICEHNDTGSPDPGPVRFEACALIGAASGVQPAGARVLVTTIAGPVALGEPYGQAEGCYFQNTQGQIMSSNSAGRDIAYDRCLFVCNWTTAAAHEQITWGGFESAGAIMRAKNCTFYTSVGAQAINNCIDYQAANGTNVGIVDVYNNLWFMESSAGSPAAVFMQGIGGAAAVTNAGLIDYNGFIGGPNFGSAADFSAAGPYNEAWGTSGVFKTHDQQLYGQAESAVFANPSSTYAWDSMSTGRTITIFKDLRPKVFLTSGNDGLPLGALPSVNSDISVALLASRLHPEVGDTVTLTMTITNTGTIANSIVATLPVPAGVTLASSAVSQGSYNSGTGQWSVGTMMSGTSDTLELVFTINADQGGETITATATYVSSDITDTNSSNNVASVDIEVVDDDDPIGGGGGGDGANPYIDVLPIFTDYMQLDASCRLQTRVNRVVRSYNRFDKRRGRFREFDTKRVTIAGSTTASINMGGIERARFLAVEATGPVEISISTSVDTYWPQATFLLVGMTDFEILKVRNPLTTSVDVLITAVD